MNKTTNVHTQPDTPVVVEVHHGPDTYARVTLGRGMNDVTLFSRDPDWLAGLAKTVGDLADDLRAAQADREAA